MTSSAMGKGYDKNFLPKFAQIYRLNYRPDSACPGIAVFHGEIKKTQAERKTSPPPTRPGGVKYH